MQLGCCQQENWGTHSQEAHGLPVQKPAVLHSLKASLLLGAILKL